jgi:hypothetical protein
MVNVRGTEDSDSYFGKIERFTKFERRFFYFGHIFASRKQLFSESDLKLRAAV